MLLTPERKVFGPNPVSELDPPPITEILQKRACFTAMERSELFRTRFDQRHVDVFGPFAIGLNAQKALSLGMLPVFYLPVSSGESGGGGAADGFLGQDLLNRLCELRSFLAGIAQIEHLAHPGNELFADKAYLDTYNIKPPPNDLNVPFLNKLDQRRSVELFQYLNTDRPPAYILAEFIEIILSIFQQVQSDRDNFLEYYDQREWRIVSIASESLHCIDLNPRARLSLSDSERLAAEAAEVDIAKLLAQFSAPYKVSDCAIMCGVRKTRFFDLIDEVLIPVNSVQAIETGFEQLRWMQKQQCPENPDYLLYTKM
jgi:hypothetical protein